MKPVLLTVVCLLSISASALAEPPPFNDGVSLYNQGKYNEAIEVFEKSLADNPNDVTAHYYEALCYHCTGRLPAAFQEYTWVSKHASDPEMLRRAQFGLTALSRAGVTSTHSFAERQAASEQPTTTSNSNDFPPVAPAYGAARGGQNVAQNGLQQPYQYRAPAFGNQAKPPYAGSGYGGQSYNAGGYGASGYGGPGYAPQPYGATNYRGQPAYASPTNLPPPPQPGFQRGFQVPDTTVGNGLPLIAPPSAVRQPSGPAPRVIDMYTDWCGWCKVFEPFFLQAQAKYGSLINFQRANAEDSANRDLVKKYKVRGFPTLLYFNASGKLVKRSQGAPQSLQAFEDELFSVFPEMRR